jgi:Myelin basic protein
VQALAATKALKSFRARDLDQLPVRFRHYRRKHYNAVVRFHRTLYMRRRRSLQANVRRRQHKLRS